MILKPVLYEKLLQKEVYSSVDCQEKQESRSIDFLFLEKRIFGIFVYGVIERADSQYDEKPGQIGCVGSLDGE